MYSILLVEDEFHINELLKETLEKEGYGCVQAFSGTEARMLLEKYQYDVVLLDLMLPGLGGEAVLRNTGRGSVEGGLQTWENSNDCVDSERYD